MEALLSRAEVAQLLGIAERTLDQMRAEDRFPAGIKVTPRRTRWSPETVRGWLASKCEGQEVRGE